MKGKFIIGIDEVGRGACAGPLYVCAFALPQKFPLKVNGLPPLRDSKQLSPRQREEWLSYFSRGRKEGKVAWAIARISHKEIDRKGMAYATKKAATRASEALVKKEGRPGLILLDGSLYVDSNNPALKNIRAKTIIKGDEKIPAISCASIVAKVMRDSLMARSCKAYPGYGFERHKGYGTRAHRVAVSRRGPSAIHRLTFIRGWVKIQTNK